ncbi:MAG: DUF3488 and transglutaminase-like domain-containing protein [Nakamurella sp.]
MPQSVNSHATPTLFGALAVIGGSTALTPLISGTSWLLPIVEVVAVIWLVGVATRLVGTPSWAVELLQLVAFSMSVTGLQLHSGIGGFVPGSAAIDEATAAVRAAWVQIMTTLPPTPATAEISLFVTITIGALAWVCDQFIAGAKAPALVGLPLLGLYSVPAAISSEMLPWYAFALPAACFAAVLATSQPHFGRLNAKAALSLVVTSAVIAVSAIGASVALSDTAPSIGTEGRLPHMGQPGGHIGLSPWALLRGELSKSDPVDVARVAGLTTPTYLRTFALEKWEPGAGFGLGTVSADSRNIDGALPGTGDSENDSARDIESITITPQQYRDKFLPIYLDSTGINGIGSGWNFDSELGTIFRTDATTPAPYTVTADTAMATEAELRSDTAVGRQDLTEATDVPAEVSALAKRLTAGTTNSFDAVNALLNFFTDPANGFTYSLQTPLGNSGNALSDFLSSRSGYCEQYAAAMAIMVRTLGIPARVGIGFTQGAEQPDGSYQVTSNDAHAWVEVSFAKTGWVIFDPTPSVDGQGGLQGFSSDTASPSSTAPTTGTAAATPTTGASAPATALSTRKQSATATVTRTTTAAGSTHQGNTNWGRVALWIGLIALIGAALALATAAPSLLRRRRRQHRLAHATSGGPGSASAAWQEIVDTAVDHGIDVGVGDSIRTVANTIAQHAALSAHARMELRAVVTSVEKDWYGPELGLSDPPAESTQSTQAERNLAPSVHAVSTGLQHTYPLSWPHRWWPRSLRRKQ